MRYVFMVWASLILFALTSPAHATTVCLKINQYTNDTSNGGDFITNTYENRWLRGIRYEVKTLSGDHLVGGQAGDGLGSWDPGLGCFNMPLTSSGYYSIHVWSEGYVNGNSIEVRTLTGSSAPHHVQVHYLSTWFSTQSVLIDPPSSLEAEFNVYSHAAWALYRTNGGNWGDLFKFKVGFGQAKCTTGCYSWIADTIYIYRDWGAHNSKHTIAHELGHAVQHHRSKPTVIPREIDFDEGGNCGAPGDYIYAFSMEYVSASVAEAYGEYYSANAYNSTNQSDCTVQGYNCENGSKFMESSCSGPYAGKGVAVDWVRFFWDMRTDQNVSNAKIFGLIDSSHAITNHNIFNVMKINAATLGISTKFDSLADFAGIDWPCTGSTGSPSFCY